MTKWHYPFCVSCLWFDFCKNQMWAWNISSSYKSRACKISKNEN